MAEDRYDSMAKGEQRSGHNREFDPARLVSLYSDWFRTMGHTLIHQEETG